MVVHRLEKVSTVPPFEERSVSVATPELALSVSLPPPLSSSLHFADVYISLMRSRISTRHDLVTLHQDPRYSVEPISRTRSTTLQVSSILPLISSLRHRRSSHPVFPPCISLRLTFFSRIFAAAFSTTFVNQLFVLSLSLQN